MTEADAGTQAKRRTTVTISDVAAAAGVSASAVSRALNKPGRMNATTESRIRDIAADLGYRINPMARALQTGRTRMIALMVSDITNPVYSELIRGAESVSSDEEYTLVFAESHDSPDQEVRSVDRLVPAVDGVVLVAPRVDDARIRAIAADTPVIVVNREVAGLPTFVPDDEAAIQDAVSHLYDFGHRTIAYLAGPAASWMSAHRGETLRAAADVCGIQLVDLGPHPATLENGPAGLTEVRASGATAVVAYNDIMAMGLLMAARGRDAALPRTPSVIGFDDVFGAQLVTPALTTIRSPLAAAGSAALRRLIDELDGNEARPAPPLTAELIVRESTGPAV